MLSIRCPSWWCVYEDRYIIELWSIRDLRMSPSITWPTGSSVISMRHRRLTDLIWSSGTHTCVHLLWFSHVLHRSSHQLPSAPSFSPERWLHMTLQRRYQGNWQWLEICGINEPRPVWLTGLGPPSLWDRPFLQSHQWHSICVKAPFEGPPGVRFD